MARTIKRAYARYSKSFKASVGHTRLVKAVRRISDFHSADCKRVRPAV